MDDFAQPAQLAEPTDLSRLVEHAGDGVSYRSFVEGPDGRAYVGTQSDGQFNTVADLAWGRALRQLQAGQLPSVADIDRALASLVIARAEPGEGPATAVKRLAATGDVVFGALCAGRRQACQSGPDPR